MKPEDPTPLSYATPRPRQFWIWLVAVLAGIAVVAGVAAKYLRRGANPISISIGKVTIATSAPAFNPVSLPKDPLRFSIAQRSSYLLPGGTKAPVMWIGDITGGQVHVTVSLNDGSPAISQSMRVGESASFDDGTQAVYLKLAKLRGKLMGTDEADFDLSLSPIP